VINFSENQDFEMQDKQFKSTIKKYIGDGESEYGFVVSFNKFTD